MLGSRLLSAFFCLSFLGKAHMSSSSKSIKEVLRKPPAHWVGDGFNVFPVFANKAFTNELSPFIMFDYAAPKQFGATTQQRGVGQHPHRGFETITLAFQGEVEHADSQGNRGVIGPGDVQWMTAARGIVHEEFHSREFSKTGGIMEMCQIWLNLPAKNKMSKPRYQPILDKDIPRVPLASSTDVEETKECTGGEGDIMSDYVRVIAGNYGGIEGAAKTFTPVDLFDMILATKDKSVDVNIPEGHNTIVFVRRGAIEVQGQTLNLADVAILNPSGTKVIIKALQENTCVLILSGQPINEPIAARGPFVMNTQKELMEAIQDFQMGRNGF